MDDYTPTPRCANPACGAPFLADQDGQTYCSPRCRETSKKRRQRFRVRHGGVGGQLLAPRGTPDPGDPERADNDEQNIYAGTAVYEHPSDVRARAMIEQDTSDARPGTTRATWREWRAYGRRHGVESPAQTQDRIQRHQAGQDGRAIRIDARTDRPQSRFDMRTVGQVASRAAESRRLNARHVDRGPIEPQAFNSEPEQTAGTFFRNGPTSGQQGSHNDYAWRMEDGFRF
jgi:predicted nucleic acid-binding Zn ribbon protein